MTVGPDHTPVADPGFPVGRGADLRPGHFSAKTYMNTKELGPVGEWGVGAECRNTRGAPGSANVCYL